MKEMVDISQGPIKILLLVTDLRQCGGCLGNTLTALSAGGGVDCVDGDIEETVEGLLNYRRRSQASCICTHEFKVTESMDPLEEAMKTNKEQLR